jgi:hypothetical protein
MHFYKRLVSCFGLAALLETAISMPILDQNDGGSNRPAVRTIYQYPRGICLENVDVRKNGELLVTLLNKPELNLLDPLQEALTPKVITSFLDVQAVTGIIEIGPDIYAVAAGNYTLSSGGVKGSWSIWTVDLTSDPKVEKITSIPDATFLNGVISIRSSSYPNKVIVGDVDQGVIQRIDPVTGVTSLAVNNSLTALAWNPTIGNVEVNGIDVQDSTPYLASIGKGVFGKIPNPLRRYASRLRYDYTKLCRAGAGLQLRGFHCSKAMRRFLSEGMGTRSKG